MIPDVTAVLDELERKQSEWLKPCPFCGGAAEVQRLGTRAQSSLIGCTECSVTVEANEDGPQTGTHWNRRVDV